MAGAEHDYVVYQRGEEGESDAWDDTVLIKAYDNAVSAMKAKLAEQHPEFSSVQPSLKPKKKKNKTKCKKKQKHHQSTHIRWKVGDLCQAVYSVDGEIYEARIIFIDEAKQTCTLEYVDYGNEEEQLLSKLLPIDSPASSQEQQTDTASETESVSKAHNVPEASFNKQRNKRSSSHQHFQSTQHAPKWPWKEFPPAPPFGHMPAPPPPYPQFQPPHPFPGFQAHGSTSSIPPMFPCVPPPPPLFTERGSGDENEALYSMLISWYMSGYHTGYYQGLKQSAANASAASGHRSHR